jgi:peptide/nickel transport system ATP-binding protein
MEIPLLHIKNLSVDFVTESNQTPALKQVSLSVKRGEIVAIVGESGSGKSVTSLSILQLLPSPPALYSNGSIEFYHHNKTIDLLQADAPTLQSIRGSAIAMIFQEPMSSLNPVMTCGRQIMEAILRHTNITTSEARAKTIALLEKVQLPEPAVMFNRYPHQLSGGQKQRVMIAMAMSCEPSLLICDEPTTSLDVTVQKNILQLIQQLQRQNNMGVIFITHDLGLVAEIADRVAVMYKGEIVEENTTAAIFNHPQHPYTKALLACRPLLHQKGERLPVVSDFMTTEADENPKHTIANTSNISMANATSIDTNNVLLSVQHLKVHYPASKSFLGKVLSYNKAVDDVSFDVYAGETLGLVGESGCGKTTLGRAVLQLIPATAGDIYFKDKHLNAATSAEMKALRKDMQIIFQDPFSSLNPRLTVGAAIAEPLIAHELFNSQKERKEYVIDLLEKVNLNANHYNRYPHEFSGGQRQRIVIARALALKPSFIVCDESVSALDVSVQAQVLNLLNDLKKAFEFTAIFISHDLSVIKYISDRIMVMNKGKIEEIGDAQSVYEHPQSTYTQKLIAAIPKGIVQQ